MKIAVLFTLLSVSTWAQMPKLNDVVSTLKEASKPIMEACKEDKSNIKACESYTDVNLLKVCLIQNKDRLSDKCKTALKLK